MINTAVENSIDISIGLSLMPEMFGAEKKDILRDTIESLKAHPDYCYEIFYTAMKFANEILSKECVSALIVEVGHWRDEYQAELARRGK